MSRSKVLEMMGNGDTFEKVLDYCNKSIEANPVKKVQAQLQDDLLMYGQCIQSTKIVDGVMIIERIDPIIFDKKGK